MKVIALFALIGLAAASYAPAHVANTGSSVQSRTQDSVGNYAFAYQENHATGGTSRKESGNAYGQVVGSYSLGIIDGRQRTVNYVADPIHGFRAQVLTNEPGTAPTAEQVAAAAPVLAKTVAPIAAAPAYAAPLAAPAYGVAKIAAPALAYSAPVHSYGYAAPSYGYAAPIAKIAAPVVAKIAAPTVAYSAPVHSYGYAAPSYGYAAPIAKVAAPVVGYAHAAPSSFSYSTPIVHKSYAAPIVQQHAY